MLVTDIQRGWLHQRQLDCSKQTKRTPVVSGNKCALGGPDHPHSQPDRISILFSFQCLKSLKFFFQFREFFFQHKKIMNLCVWKTVFSGRDGVDVCLGRNQTQPIRVSAIIRHIISFKKKESAFSQRNVGTDRVIYGCVNRQTCASYRASGHFVWRGRLCSDSGFSLTIK